MANFCNQFDLVCTELGCAVIYCHHHSKGGQGHKKAADRASGSGVFARDPDALLDLIELDVTDAVRKAEVDQETVKICTRFLDANARNWRYELSQDDACVAHKMLEFCKNRLCKEVNDELANAISEAEKTVQSRTAWRVEGTLREFPKFPAKYLWFDYPRHRMDDVGVLKDLEAESEAPPWQRASKKAEASKKKKTDNKRQKFEDAVANCCMGEPPTVKDLVQWFSDAGEEIPERTMRDWIKKFGFWIDKNTGKVLKIEKEKD
jgi:RecA-family ATPase